RMNEEDQFALAEESFANQEDPERVILSFMRVYQFFSARKNVSPYETRALYRAAIEYHKRGDLASSREIVKILRSLSTNAGDYCHVKASVLDSVLSGKDARDIFVRALSQGTEKGTVSYLKEDAADYFFAKGDSVKAVSLYKDIIASDPSYRGFGAVNYNLGAIESKTGVVIPDSFITVFRKGKQEQKDRANLDIISILSREKDAKKRVALIESLRNKFNSEKNEKDKTPNPVLPVLAYAEGLAYAESGDSVKADEWMKRALSSIKTYEILYYEINVRLAKIAARNGKPDDEEKHLALVANNYLPRWNRPDFPNVIQRLVSYYEKTGGNFEATGKYDKAADLYTRYVGMLTYLHLKKKFEDEYNEYAPRAHVLYIDSFALSKKDYMDALDELEKKYLQRRDIARMDFDKAYLYGLGYIYAKRGAEQERLMDSSTLPVTDDALIESYQQTQTQIAWAFFMDDTFVDPYLLQGWINQSIDMRRKNLQSKNSAYHLWKFNKAFPPYLWEQNKAIYEKGLEANDASRFPEKSGSLHLNLGNTYFLLTNFPLALEQYELAAKYKKSFGSKKEESLFRYHLSYCYWQVGKTADATREMMRVYDIYSDLGASSAGRQYSEQLSNIDEYLALFARTSGNYAEAIKWHERALADSGVLPRSDPARINLDIAWCAVKLGDYSYAERTLEKAESLLTKEKNDDQEFVLRFYLFYVVGIDFIDLGPDKVVIGDSRIFSHLSVAQKRLLLLSIREELGMSKGDYASVASAVSAKLDVLKGRETEIDKETTIRAYNGVGNSMFRLGKYLEARDYFEKGWKFATNPDVNNLKGAFVSIKNLVSLYGFLLENEATLIKNPAADLADFAGRIEKYRAAYEDARYAEIKAQIEDDA
ncbi:MAG TPA: tetratricopeptide repeat protein, partial [Spirochaetota bacterium]